MSDNGMEVNCDEGVRWLECRDCWLFAKHLVPRNLPSRRSHHLNIEWLSRMRIYSTSLFIAEFGKPERESRCVSDSKATKTMWFT
jgi:hypothetical protein